MFAREILDAIFAHNLLSNSLFYIFSPFRLEMRLVNTRESMKKLRNKLKRMLIEKFLILKTNTRESFVMKLKQI